MSVAFKNENYSASPYPDYLDQNFFILCHQNGVITRANSLFCSKFNVTESALVGSQTSSICSEFSQSTSHFQLSYGGITIECECWYGSEMGEEIIFFHERAQDSSNNSQSIDDLNQVLEDFRLTAEDLIELSSGLSQKVNSTQERTENLSHAMDQLIESMNIISSNMDELNHAVSEVSQNTKKAHTFNQSAKEKTEFASGAIASLSQSSESIGNIIKMISSIAQQTNLLALNATIEAARAGDAGKGFGVVATEVKELAKQSASASNDISQIITTLQSDSNSVGGAIGDVSLSIGSIFEASAAISTSMEEQSATSNQVKHAVSEVNQAVQSIGNDLATVKSDAQGTGADAFNVLNTANSLKILISDLENRIKAIS